MAHIVTAGELLDGHSVLDIECLDRVYLNAYVPALQSSGQVVAFMTQHLGKPIPSPALMEQIGTRFRKAAESCADANEIPWVKFGKADRRVTCYYFYLRDQDLGPAFVKVCAYFPYPAKIRVNGREWAKRQALKAGIGFTELASGFASCDDPAGLQEIRDRLQAGTIEVFAQRWPHRIPMPFGSRDRDAGYWRECSMRQVEVSRTVVFDAPHRARSFFEALIAGNLDLGRPENVEIIFGRRARCDTPGAFRTAIDRPVIDPDDKGVVVNIFCRRSRVEQCLKEGRAMRTETVANCPRDLNCNARPPNLDELQDKARAINRRILEAERAGQAAVLASPAFERIAHPTADADGRRTPAPRFGDPRVTALAGALAATLTAATGITNKSLRALMTALPHAPHTPGQMTYDLRRLRLADLIRRIEHTSRYALTPDGIKFAVFHTKLHNRPLRPLMAAGQAPAPPELRHALDVIGQHVDDYINRARLGKAA